MPSPRVPTFANLSLQTRIGLVVLAGLAVGLGLFSWLGIQSLNESTERVLDERLTIARIEAGRLDALLSQIITHLENAAEFDGGFPATGDFHAAAISVHRLLTRLGIDIENVLLFDTTARVVELLPPQADVVGTIWADRPEIRRTLAEGAATITGLVTTPVPGPPVVVVSVPIIGDGGATVGALSGTISMEQSGGRAFGSIAVVGETGYTEIVDGSGIVLARTSPGVPVAAFETSDHPGRFAELIEKQQATVGTCHRCHVAEESVARYRDVLAFATLSTTTWGVAVRQSEEEALAPTRRLEQRLLLLGTVVVASTILTLWFVLKGVVSPIKLLTEAAKSVAAGNFRTVIPVRRKDDIGELSRAFQTMTQELARSQGELLRRNEELSALNSIATTVSQSLDLEEVLGNALERALEVTRTAAGCVFLRDGEGDVLRAMGRIGPTDSFRCSEAGSATAVCACHQVLSDGETLMVNDLAQCPILDRNRDPESGSGFFLSVPLKSKNRTLGTMNIACPDDRYFTEDDFRLLDSIGHHIGLAIENSVLYQESRQKENLRGQILSQVIKAQEEERKRIARELHDEYGQMLTALIMSIESAETATTAEQSRLKEKLASLKAVASEALDGMRRMTFDLRPSMLDDLGLAAAVRSFLQANLEDAGIRVNFSNNTSGETFSPEAKIALYRIIQEAVNNIIKYAEASTVTISLEARDGKITTIIDDDGRGFDVDRVYSSRIGAQSLGLLGIQERATLLGGTFRIRSEEGGGTRLTVEIPALPSLPKEASDEAARDEPLRPTRSRPQRQAPSESGKTPAHRAGAHDEPAGSEPLRQADSAAPKTPNEKKA